MMYMLIPLLSIFVPMLAAVAVVFLIRFWRRRDGRRSPLTDKLHHGPGEQLRRELKKTRDGIVEALTAISFIRPFLICAWPLPKLDWSKNKFGLGEWILSIFFVGMLAWAIRKITRLQDCVRPDATLSGAPLNLGKN